LVIISYWNKINEGYQELGKEGLLEELLRGAQLQVGLFVVDIHKDHVELVLRLHLVIKYVLVGISND
jgi:hypothetical protein